MLKSLVESPQINSNVCKEGTLGCPDFKIENFSMKINGAAIFFAPFESREDEARVWARRGLLWLLVDNSYPPLGLRNSVLTKFSTKIFV